MKEIQEESRFVGIASAPIPDSAPLLLPGLRPQRPGNMVSNYVWQAAGGSGMLCLDCLARRLGRPLVRDDFGDLPCTTGGCAVRIPQGSGADIICGMDKARGEATRGYEAWQPIMTKQNLVLKQAKILCGMGTTERLDFIAKGLPIILESARGFWSASGRLAGKPREADVLQGFAEEEAAKILILMDVVRCPPKLISRRLGSIVHHFYNHLARLIYAKAQGWYAMDVSQLRKYVELERPEHYLDGYVGGEYIFPNWAVAARERLLYADIEVDEDQVPYWNKPGSYTINLGFPNFVPMALRVVEALSAVGIFSRKGLDATAEIWGQLEFKDAETRVDAERLTKQLLLKLDVTMQQEFDLLCERWQMPMYHFKCTGIDVSLEELEEERASIMSSEAWY